MAEEEKALIVEKSNKSKKTDMAGFTTKGINSCYLLSLLMTISIGTI